MKELSIVEARNRLTRLPEELAEGGALTITRRGKPVLAVMPHAFYDSLMETLEIMSDPEMMTLLRQSIREADENNVVKWESVKRKMKL